ncbi:MAG: 50S ribosomal protein L11 methyltransferase [Aquabacterium sp.]
MFELVLWAPQAMVEAVSDLLIEALDARSVSVEDADAGTAAEQAMFGEPDMPPPAAGWQHSVLVALFEDDDSAAAAAAWIGAQPELAGVQMRALRPLVEQDWVRLTQAQFPPVPVTDDFWIVPTWHALPDGARTSIRLDPGLAFGTGSHPTTLMCLRWIARHAQAWPRVLDYGCGSGILAIAAGLHGACDIDAVDIDRDAAQTAQVNAQANRVMLRTGLPDVAQGTYPLVLANILATPLKLLAPLLCDHVAPGGHLVLAGILDRQAAELAAAYAPWLTLTVDDQLDGWILMTAQRRMA